VILKKYTRQDGFSEIELLHSSIDHLASAKSLFNTNPRCFDSAGYLSHLGIELILKALLLNKCAQFPNEHSLVKLSRLISDQKVALNYTKDHERTLKTLDEFYELRYPKNLNPIEIGQEDWTAIESFFEHLIFLFPDQIQQELRQLDCYSKKGNRILMVKKENI